jgi:biopolymer transport protein ExbD
MPRSTVYRAKGLAGEVSINLTPMVDCVFLLIIFFILAGQIASQSLAKGIELYEPEKSQALKWDEQNPNRVIVNVLSMAGPEKDDLDSSPAGHAKGYLIGGKLYEVEDIATLVEELKRRSLPYLQKDQDFFVEIRADKRVYYGDVEPILWAAAEARIPKMNITALLRTKK